MNHSLILLNNDNIFDYLPEIYRWSQSETEREYYTCRPIKKLAAYEKYSEFIIQEIQNGLIQYVLIQEVAGIPVGKITLFDYNPRNYSAELGYYVSQKFRNQGYGTILLNLFLEQAFQNTDLKLNKVYATVSSRNQSSIKLLDKFDFKFEGAIREHYWFDDGTVCDQHHYSLLKREYGSGI